MILSKLTGLFRVGALVALATGVSAPEVLAEEPVDSMVSIVASINAAGHVTVSQLEALTRRLSYARVQAAPGGETDEVAEGNRIETVAERRQASATRAGYRIQVFDDNNPRSARSSAASYKNRVESAFPAYRAYVSFNSPYWRVKVGDFRSRAEAESAQAEIRRAFPELKAYIRIVRDRINIYD